MNNPEHVEQGDILVKHGSVVLEDVPRDFEGIKEYLRTHMIEGIVFHRGMVKCVRLNVQTSTLSGTERQVNIKQYH